MKAARGFTLIEVLIVIVIIGIVASMAVITMGRHRHQDYENIAAQLANTLILAEEEAILRPAVLGFTIKGNVWQFFILQYEKKTGKNIWVLMNEPVLRSRTIPDHIQMNLILNHASQVIIRPNHELTPFTLWIGKKGETPYYRVSGKENGEVISERVAAP